MPPCSTYSTAAGVPTCAVTGTSTVEPSSRSVVDDPAEVLQVHLEDDPRPRRDDPRRGEGQFHVRDVGRPRGDVAHGRFGHRLAVDVPEHGLEEDPDTHREGVEVTEPLLFEDGEVGHPVRRPPVFELADRSERVRG
jgi:hypothetical protein